MALLSFGVLVRPVDINHTRTCNVQLRSISDTFPVCSFFHRHCQSPRNFLKLLDNREELSRSEPKSLVPSGKKLEQSALVTNVLFGTNTVVLLAWYATRLFQFHDGFEWMASHFLLTSNKRGKRMKPPYTIITSSFSHIDLVYFSSNMAALVAFLPDVVRDLGCLRFAYFYVASAYASQIFEEAVFSRSNRKERYSLGASGVVSGVMTFYCLSFPRNSVSIFGQSLAAPLAALVQW